MRVNISKVVLISTILAVAGCSKISNMGSNKIDCGDSDAIVLLEEALQKSIDSDAKDYSRDFETRTSGSNIRASINQLTTSLSQIRTTKEDPQSTKNFCMGTLKVTIPVDMIENANFTREYYSELDIEEDAYQQDIDLDANALTYTAEYSVQPTDDGKFVFVEMQNGGDLSNFLANIVIDANQKSNVKKQKALQNKSIAQAAIDAEKAEESAAIAAQSALASIAAEQAAVKAEMDYKRNEFNTLWKSASTSAQESLTDNQKQWVKYRNESCIDEAKSAEAVRQEIVRMECITKMLGERYYEVKNYFDSY